MRTPFQKMKKADRNLMMVLMFCLFMGIAFLGFSLWAYLKHAVLNELDYDKQTLFDIARAVVYWIFPSVGAGYFVVGYAIWNYRRKRGIIKEHDKPDA